MIGSAWAARLRWLFLCCALLGMLAFSTARATEVEARQVLTEFLQQQSQSLGGEVQIHVGAIELGGQTPCTAYQAFMPPRVRLTGKTWVGLRCLSPQSWSMMVSAQIAVLDYYVVAAQDIRAGTLLAPEHLSEQYGDLTLLPGQAVTNMQDALGWVTRTALRGGQALSSGQLRAPHVIQRGQSVRVNYRGRDFSVTSEGKAMHQASVGQSVTVRMGSGRSVTGIANADGDVEVAAP